MGLISSKLVQLEETFKLQVGLLNLFCEQPERCYDLLWKDTEKELRDLEHLAEMAYEHQPAKGLLALHIILKERKKLFKDIYPDRNLPKVFEERYHRKLSSSFKKDPFWQEYEPSISKTDYLYRIAGNDV
jgi:hypothetical protein